MQRRIAQIFGTLAAIVAFAGIISQDGRLYGLINVDIALDAIHIIVAVAMLYAGFARSSAHHLHNILAGTAALYVGIAVLGFMDQQLWGFAPAGLSGFDVLTYMAGGLIAAFAAFMPHARNSAAHA